MHKPLFGYICYTLLLPISLALFSYVRKKPFIFGCKELED
jgi:hypothetical protein